MSKNSENTSKTIYARPFEGDVEYEMSKEMAKQILATRKGVDQNVHPQEFLCRVVNEDFGIKGNCVRVLTT